MTTNKIKTICFDLNAVTREDVDVCTNAIHDIDLGALFESVIEEIDDGKTWRRVDSLEIDLGDVDFSDTFELRQSLVAGFRQALGDQYSGNTQLFSNTRFSSPVGTTHFADGEAITGVGRSLEIFIYYLQYGSLPWYVHERPVDVKRLLDELLAESPHQLRRSLLTVIDNRRVTARLATVFDVETNLRVLELFFDAKDLSVVREIIQIIGKHHANYVQFTKRFIAQLYFLVDEISSQHERITGTLERFVLFLRTASVNDIIRAVSKIETTILSGVSTLPTILEKIDHEIIKNIHKATNEADKTNETTTSAAEVVLQADENYFEVEHEQPSELDELYIENSGLVILNQGLISQYLTRLGWIADKKFVSEEATSKAVLWLHYLIHGDNEAHEYDLALNKIICGIDPADVVDTRIILSELEKQTATELLETILAHWTAPGKISTQALRQTFLLRKGRLTMEEGGWHLHVESHTWDILLERLPWMFSIFRLPWMTKPIYTQWQTRT